MSSLYVLKESEESGPFTAEELGQHVEDGVFSREDLFWTEGMDEWEPLSGIIEIVTEEGAMEEPEAVEEAPEEVVEEPTDVLHQEGGATVKEQAVHLASGEEIAMMSIAKADVQSETVERVKPAFGLVVIIAVLVGFFLANIPRTTPTHWVLWSLVLIVLILWGARLLREVLQRPVALVVIDLRGGDKRIVRSRPGKADDFCRAINNAIKAHTPSPLNTQRRR